MNGHVNDELWKNPFSKQYWLEALKGFKNVKKLVLTSILIAMMIVVNVYSVALNIEILGNKVYFEFIPSTICSMLMGPVIGIAAGAISDILGFIIMPGGYSFFFGYTLSAILASLVYALFLYKTKITIVKIFLAKFVVNLFVNVLLGSLWRVMMMGVFSMYWSYVILSLTKNMLLLPFEVAILYFLLRYLIPISKSAHVMSIHVPDVIHFM